MRRLNDAYNAAKSWSLYEAPPSPEQPKHLEHTLKPTPEIPQSKTHLIPREVVALGLMVLVLALPFAIVIALRETHILTTDISDNRVCSYSTPPYSGPCGRH
jgi:hypothetical protein